MNNLVDTSLWSVSPAEARIVLITLIAFTGPEGDAMFPSLNMLAKKAELSVADVKKGLAALMQSDGERIPVTKLERGWRVNDIQIWLTELAQSVTAYRSQLNAIRIKRCRAKNPEKVKADNAKQREKRQDSPAPVPAPPPEEKTPEEKVPSEHTKMMTLWTEYYLKLHEVEYKITGRDGVAVKSLLKTFETAAAVMEFAKSVHARAHEGFPFGQSYTLYDLANNLNRLRAGLATKPAKQTVPVARETHKGRLYPESFESLPVLNPNAPDFDPAAMQK